MATPVRVVTLTVDELKELMKQTVYEAVAVLSDKELIK